MRSSATSNAALETLRTRLKLVARDVSCGLAALSAQVNELPEAQRPRLRAALLDLKDLQSQLWAFVDQALRGDTADPGILQTAIRHHLDVLEQMKEFAMLIERIGPKAQASGRAVTGSSAAYHEVFAELLQRARRPAVNMLPSSAQAAEHWHPSDNRTPWMTTLPPVQAQGSYLPAPHVGVYQHLLPNGYYMIIAPAWPQQRPVRTDEYSYDRDQDAYAPRRRRRRLRDEEPHSRLSWSGLRNLGSPALVFAALLVGGVAFSDRMYGNSGRGDMDTVEQSEPGRDVPVLSEGKFQGRLVASEPPAKSRVPAATERTDPVPPTSQIDSTEPSSWPSPQRRLETAAASTAAGSRPSMRLRVKAPEPTLDPSPPRAAAPRKKIKLAMAAPPVVAAKLVAPKPAAAPADPDVSEPNDGLFVPVLSTHKDAKAARKAFNELQKQHLPVLGAKQSEVQIASSETGTWYRLVVTPATSKEAAREMCNALSTEGYGRCWVKPY